MLWFKELYSILPNPPLFPPPALEQVGFWQNHLLSVKNDMMCVCTVCVQIVSVELYVIADNGLLLLYCVNIHMKTLMFKYGLKERD